LKVLKTYYIISQLHAVKKSQLCSSKKGFHTLYAPQSNPDSAQLVISETKTQYS
jgi:hypothetical protein